jgi:hypothetical protein
MRGSVGLFVERLDCLCQQCYAFHGIRQSVCQGFDAFDKAQDGILRAPR